MIGPTNESRPRAASGRLRGGWKSLWRRTGGRDGELDPGAVSRAPSSLAMAALIGRKLARATRRPRKRATWTDCTQLERHLAELLCGERSELGPRVSALGEMGLLDARQVDFYRHWLLLAHGDRLACRVMLGRLANDVVWHLGGPPCGGAR